MVFVLSADLFIDELSPAGLTGRGKRGLYFGV
jgi:hypothetical protein